MIRGTAVMLLLAAGVLLRNINWSDLEIRAAGTKTAKEPAENIVVGERICATAETSAETLNLLTLQDGKVALKTTNEVQWIDRLDLSDEEAWVRTFYDRLVEASDNDGIDDYLIGDEYFEYKNSSDGSIRYAEYTNQDGKAEKGIYLNVVTVTGKAESESDVNSAVQEIGENYQSYLFAATAAFDRDHPEVTWLENQVAFNTFLTWQTNGENAYSYTVNIGYLLKAENEDDSFDIRAEGYRSESEIRQVISKQDGYVSAVMEAVKDNNAYEKIRYFNEYLTEKNEYNTETDLDAIHFECRKSISALAGRTGKEGPVCEAYARAFKVLCDQAEIPCVLVDGITSSASQEGHMWNYTQLDGAWYGVDVTWNDPVGGIAGALSGCENEDWLLVGSDTVVAGEKFIESHPVSNTVYENETSFTNGPELSKEKYKLRQASLIENKETGGYKTTYIYNGQPLTEPQKDQFTVQGDGELSFIWYQGDHTQSQLEEDKKLAASPTEAGEYTLVIRISATENYSEAELRLKIEIVYDQTEIAILYNNAAKKDLYKENVVISAEGYTVSDTKTGNYTSSYTISEEGMPVKKTLYFKEEATGYLTDGREITVNIDKTAPVFTKLEKSSVTSNSAKISFFASEAGTVYYKAVKTGGTVPAAKEDYGNSMAMSAAANEIVVKELSSDTAYTVYLLAVDRAGNETKSSLTFTTLDDTVVPDYEFSQAGVQYEAAKQNESNIYTAGAVAAPVQTVAGETVNTTAFADAVVITPKFNTPWGVMTAKELADNELFEVKVSAEAVSGLNISKVNDGHSVKVTANRIKTEKKNVTVALTTTITWEVSGKTKSTKVSTTLEDFKIYNGGKGIIETIKCSFKSSSVEKVAGGSVPTYQLETMNQGRGYLLDISAADYAGNTFAPAESGDLSIKDRLKWKSNHSEIVEVSIDEKTGTPALLIPKNVKGTAKITITSTDTGKCSIAFKVAVVEAAVSSENSSASSGSSGSSKQTTDSSADTTQSAAGTTTTGNVTDGYEVLEEEETESTEAEKTTTEKTSDSSADTTEKTDQTDKTEAADTVTETGGSPQVIEQPASGGSEQTAQQTAKEEKREKLQKNLLKCMKLLGLSGRTEDQSVPVQIAETVLTPQNLIPAMNIRVLKRVSAYWQMFDLGCYILQNFK